MATELDFFRQRALAERAAAAEATLSNVRERCERSAQSWEAMARRSEQVQRSREASAAAREDAS